MNYQKLRQGDDLTISASTWNALVDQLTESRGGGGGCSPTPPPTKQLNPGVIRVANKTGGAVDRFRALEIDVPVTLPTDDEKEFQSRVTFKGVTPTGNKPGCWAVTQEALPADAIGTAVMSGITVARVNLFTKQDRWVDTRASSTLLFGGGGMELLWVKGGVGTADASGEQWAIIRVGRPLGMFPVKVTKDGGANGNKTTKATWTYTVKTLEGVQIGTGINLARPRPKGTATFQTADGYGVAFYFLASLILWDAGEIYGTGSC